MTTAPTPPELALAFRETVTRLGRQIRRQASTGMPLMQIAVLTIVDQETLTVGELASREHVRSQTMTAVVDRLEEQGFVERRRDHRDRRVVRVAITAKGRRYVDKRHARADSYLEGLVDTMTASERRAFSKAISSINDLLDREL